MQSQAKAKLTPPGLSGEDGWWDSRCFRESKEVLRVLQNREVLVSGKAAHWEP